MSAVGVDDASAPRVRQIAPVAVALLTAGLSAGAPSSARAQAAGDPLRDALVAHRLAVEVEEAGRLGGPGGRRLVSEGAAAQFFLIGEEHGIAEVPELAAWLFERLVPHGYRHLAVEIGPAIADTMAALARSSDPEDALIDFFRGHPPGAPFFNSAEEARLLIRAVDAVGM